MNDFVRPESMEVPDGGLATFLTATVGDWADDKFASVADKNTYFEKIGRESAYLPETAEVTGTSAG